jgi:hypothetical protein
LDPGCWILRHCIAPPGFNLAAYDGLVVISVVSGYTTEYTLPHSSHADIEQCTEHAGYCMRIREELNAVNGGVVQWSWVRIFVFLGVNRGLVHGRGFESLTF